LISGSRPRSRSRLRSNRLRSNPLRLAVDDDGSIGGRSLLIQA
jgi:hypothetical protein